MKLQESQMQKEKNAPHKLLIVVILFYSTLTFSQNKIEGKYIVDDNPSYIVHSGAGVFTTYEFYSNGTFFKEDSGELGIETYAEGHYFIKNDSITLDYDLTKLKTNDYHNYKYYSNNKDSLKVKITIRDMNNKPLPDIAVLNFQNKIEEASDENGVIEFSLKKEKKKIALRVANESLGYYINIWLNRNYDINVFLRQDNYPTAFKNQVVKYKILTLSKEVMKLQNGKHTMVLKRKKQ